MLFHKKGFTLIELLIVVAIIAILAAIAIPNFLAAQIRSKVSRAKAELRTLTTALESYNIDNNVYPDDIDPALWPWYLPSVVSTPIAYISSGLLNDPFRLGSTSAIPGTPGTRYRYINYDAELNGHYTAVAEANFPHGGATASILTGIEKYGIWRLTSAGPDKTATYDDTPGHGFASGIQVYDPSNGTVSNGDIVRSQKYPEVTSRD